MSDKPPPDRASSDQSKQAAWDAVSEAELDDVLSRAASLAAELSGQIQSPDDPGASSGPASRGSLLDKPSAGLDAELEQLEHLAESVAAQMQFEENAAAIPPAPLANTVLDFMSEFTTSDQPSVRSTRDMPLTRAVDDLTAAPVHGPPDRAMPAVFSGRRSSP